MEQITQTLLQKVAFFRLRSKVEPDLNPDLSLPSVITSKVLSQNG
jgi:hypothetical protein